MADTPVFLDNDYCFACGTKNPFGLHLRFAVDGDAVTARFTPGPHLQGFAGVLHGGISSTVLDDVMNNLVTRTCGEIVVTATMETRFRQPVPVGRELVCEARLVERRGRFFRAEAQLRLADDEEVLVEGRCLMVLAEGLDTACG
jgi:acyl-coenzyme A thioesterase PaaI-like protein